MNTELEQALQYDPLAHAERITGVSYKDEQSTALLGMLLMHQQGAKKNELLKANNDTSYSNSLQENLAVLKDMGFQMLICEPIENTGDMWRVFWKPGVLIFCDSYSGDKTLNSGNAYFNYYGNPPSSLRCSYSWCGEINGTPVLSCGLDIREGFRHQMEAISENGQLLETWIERPFLWLLHYQDTKIDGFIYGTINEERISMLPAEVIAAISPKTNQ